MPRETYREERGGYGPRSDFEERRWSRGRDDDDYDNGSRRGGHVPNYGQGGYFGDYEGHSEIGRRGGQVRHERAMRAHHESDEPFRSRRERDDYDEGPRGRRY